MRHLKGYRKLGRESSHRKAMLRNLATSFTSNGRVRTTVCRAKELRPIVENLITQGKKMTLASRRRVASTLFTKEAVRYLFSEIAPRFKDRQGGYTRIVRHGHRAGDNADMCALELVDYGAHEGLVRKKNKEEAQKKKIEKMKEEEQKAKTMPV